MEQRRAGGPRPPGAGGRGEVNGGADSPTSRESRILCRVCGGPIAWPKAMHVKDEIRQEGTMDARFGVLEPHATQVHLQVLGVVHLLEAIAKR